MGNQHFQSQKFQFCSDAPPAELSGKAILIFWEIRLLSPKSSCIPMVIVIMENRKSDCDPFFSFSMEKRFTCVPGETSGTGLLFLNSTLLSNLYSEVSIPFEERKVISPVLIEVTPGDFPISAATDCANLAASA